MNKPILQTAEDHIDSATGFLYRTILVSTENSVYHYHDYYEIFLVLSNEISHYINGRYSKLKRGDLLFIRKEDCHYYIDEPNSVCSFINIAFSEEILTELLKYIGDENFSDKMLNSKEPPSTKLSEDTIRWFIRKIQKLNTISINDDKSKRLEFRIFLFDTFIRHFPEYLYPKSKSNTNIPSWLTEFEEKLSLFENFSANTEEIVKLSGKSREHLSRSLKKYRNLTTSELINNIRTNYVLNQLKNSNIPIGDIFLEAGFENSHYGYYVFKKQIGKSPKEYRKK